MSSRSVFISYAWGTDDALVERLFKALQTAGLDVHRDKHDVGYKDSISGFMERLSSGDAVILIISDKYFRSPYCMQELLGIWQKHRAEFVDRIFPFVLPGTLRLDDPGVRLDYVEHWNKETNRLEAKIKKVGPARVGIETQKRLAMMAKFRGEVDDLIARIVDVNVMTKADLESNDFGVLKRAVFHKLGLEVLEPGPSGAEESRWSSEEAATYALGVLLVPMATRRAVGRWLDVDFSRDPQAHPDALGAVGAKVWRRRELVSRLVIVSDLLDLLSREGLSPARVREEARRLLFRLVPLHPDALPGRGVFSAEVLEGRRVGGPMDLRIDREALEASFAVRVDVGRSIPEPQVFVQAFFDELARLMKVPEPEARREFRIQHLRYRELVQQRRRRAEPVEDIARPFYPLLREWPEVEEVTEKIKELFEQAIYIDRETGIEPELLEAALHSALRAIESFGLERDHPSPQGLPPSKSAFGEHAEVGSDPLPAGTKDPKGPSEVVVGGSRGSRRAKRRVTPTLRWAHLSDLHFGTPSNRQKDILDALARDLGSLARRDGPVDLVLVTGDVAWAGRPAEFKDAETWLKLLAEDACKQVDRVFFACGNHDVVRPQTKSTSSYIHQGLRETAATSLDDPSQEVLGALWSKLENYASFVSSFGQGSLTAQRPFQCTAMPSELGPIAVAGLNTALLSMDDKDRGRLALGRWQLREVFSLHEDALLFCLLHHPPSWLLDGAALETKLENRASLAFCGHLHEAGGEVKDSFGRSRLFFRAGGAYASEPTEYTYSVGELSSRALRFFPRIITPTMKEFVPHGTRFKLTENNESLRLTPSKLPTPLRDWLSRRGGA